jgi:uncharacterized protein (DUF1684 family)
MKSAISLFPILLILLFTGCNGHELGQAPVPDNYEEQINEWKEYRVGVLKGPTDWLRLDGIYWLDEGENSFGSGSDQDLQFPEGTIPRHAGVAVLRDGQVVMRVANGVEITHEGEAVKEMVLFDGENRPRVKHKDLEWFIDSRGEQRGIRLYNKDNPKADTFTGFPFYPLDPSWHLKARFIPSLDNTTISVVNVQGEVIDRESPGIVEFTIDGEKYTLDAFEARSGLFLIFSDLTNRTETYQAGRYMIIPFPDDEGYTIIDFNKAYNMPCAFNKFTTCQLPPTQNRLDVAIPAGEKRPVDWAGI